ncbi:hypothetical protein H257_09382 [Aphanomyces astaci]|uniref:Uncharacterized protein n=1 Tax=Aphanomyces astaci TaxID=112090 RepID=W4GCG4_APHAT|nr:hypothetical protein, variant [Aphanomyces astaci]XP_009833888.1 hypothetical protein H257_09382 [Aphanomyces astaci]ETV76975.1 hypothetical protein H257_09382 [Aphanomyces astaci]ETV76976.1 hypothetical protein, variant [Aphanomyces astaci]|eukprot:XP_009833887.1 hypothetical protein, variant [Aphanomyces astaci]
MQCDGQPLQRHAILVKANRLARKIDPPAPVVVSRVRPSDLPRSKQRRPGCSHTIFRIGVNDGPRAWTYPGRYIQHGRNDIHVKEEVKFHHCRISERLGQDSHQTFICLLLHV